VGGEGYSTDGSAASFGVLPNAKLPAGTLTSFQIWNQGTLDPNGQISAGKAFHAYVLRPTGVANQYTVIYDSGALTVPPTAATGEVTTFPVPSVAVAADDVIGWYGAGIPFSIGTSPFQATYSWPAPVAPALNSTMTLGVDPGFPIYAQNRTYSFAATVTPSG